MKKTLLQLRKFLRYTHGSKLFILLHTLSGVLGAAGMLLFVLVCKSIVDIATGSLSSGFTPYALALVGIIVAEVGLNFLSGYCQNRSEIELKNRIRQELFHSVLHCKWYEREQIHTGDIVNRMEEDVRVLSETFSSLIPSLLINLAKASGAFLLFSMLEARVAIAVAVVLPIFLLIIKLYGRKLKQFTTDIRESDSHIHSLLQESLQHRTLITTLLAAGRQVDKLQEAQQTLWGKFMKRSRFSLSSRSLIFAGFTVGYLIAFLYGATLLRQGLITFGTLTAFLQLVGQIQQPTIMLSNLAGKVIQSFSSMQRVEELMHLPLEEQQPQADCISHAVGIRFTKVAFTYPQSKRVIYKAFSYNFEPFTFTAILGETGVGKSTLFRFILSILTPDSGEVLFYNQQGAVQRATPTLRKQVAYVPQGNSLFSGTIRENLLLANPTATNQQIDEALHDAVAEFVYQLPEGVDTMCGEGGTRLSEGQAQRIAIARAFLCNSTILLLDEFSSALDSQTEDLLMQRLLDKSKQRTILLITHRLEIAARCTHKLELRGED